MQQQTRIPVERLLRLDDQVAIVTGGAMGIGLGIAQRYAEAGAAVVLADRDPAAVVQAALRLNGLGYRALALECDVAEENEIRRCVSKAVEAFGQLDVLVNNAGIYPMKAALEMTAAEWDQVQRVNLRGAFLFSREFVKHVAAKGTGGVVVNIGSIDSFQPSAVGLAAYDASKGGLWMFTRSFALEASAHGVRVNMIAPGGIATEGVQRGATGLTAQQLAEMLKAFTARIPMARMGVPDEIATVALFLASPAATYMTGASVVVDGGRMLS